MYGLMAKVETKSYMASNKHTFKVYENIETSRKEMKDDEIITIIGNMSAYRPKLHSDSKVFDQCVSKLVGSYEAPLKDAVKEVKVILLKAVEETAKKNLIEYPYLKEEVIRIMTNNIGKSNY